MKIISRTSPHFRATEDRRRKGEGEGIRRFFEIDQRDD